MCTLVSCAHLVAELTPVYLFGVVCFTCSVARLGVSRLAYSVPEGGGEALMESHCQPLQTRSHPW